MLSNETVRKLQEMHLGVMAEAFSTSCRTANSRPFPLRIGCHVGGCGVERPESNRLTRLIRNAGYADPAACVENIEYHPERSWIGSRSCAWPPAPTPGKHTMSSFWGPPAQERLTWPAPLA